MRFDRSIGPVSLLLVKLSVHSIVCLFWCRYLVVCEEQVAVGIGSVAFHDGRLLRLFLPEGSKSHFLAHKGVVYILNEARH